MKFENLEMFPVKDGGGFTVIVDGKFSSGLTIDEAIGVVASVLFAERPIFVRSYEQEVAWLKSVNAYREPVALLAGAKEGSTCP